jgi:xanthine dehydrogenase YagR molybdenum-binding subunit
MASASYPANYWGASAKARVSADGSVLIQCGTQDLGTGTYTILTQIAAEELGVSPNRVRVEIGDSSLPPAPGSGGSTSATSAGSAVLLAARAVRKAVLDLANLGDTSVVVRDGKITPGTDSGASVSYEEILKRAGKPFVEEQVTADRPTGGTHSSHGFGAQFCEVQVDEDLGVVRVTRWVGAFGLGKVLNAKTLRSQLQGGIIFGIGMGLMEDSVLDQTFGRFVTSSLVDYHLPVHLDVPPIDVIVVDETDAFVSPLGAKGAGEIGITGVAAAIANAVYNATGKRVRELPITLDKLL